MSVPPRKRPELIARSKAPTDPKVEEAVKNLMDRYPHLHLGIEGQDDEVPDGRFAEDAREFFRKHVKEQ